MVLDQSDTSSWDFIKLLQITAEVVVGVVLGVEVVAREVSRRQFSVGSFFLQVLMPSVPIVTY